MTTLIQKKIKIKLITLHPQLVWSWVHGDQVSSEVTALLNDRKEDKQLKLVMSEFS